jgi:predicted TIM-barrel fold metal-dependent hydrolase
MLEEETVKSLRAIDLESENAAAAIPSLLISADSHAVEPPNLFDKLPADMRERLPLFKGKNKRPPGGTDPKIRIVDMDKDRVAAEVLFPDQVLGAFRAEREVQEKALALYNDWVAEYCSYAPKRLFSPVSLCSYDIDQATRELKRGYDMGLRSGALIWEVPDPKLPFHSPHYEKLWATAAEMNVPVMVHILTGFCAAGGPGRDRSMESVRTTTNARSAEQNTALFDMIWSGVFERYPNLRFGLIESEVGWIPFMLQQWDFYYQRMQKTGDAVNFKITSKPSDIFRKHVTATFIDDEAGGQLLSHWGEDSCMWSSDYPHPNMTWPHSRAFAARQIGHLPMEKQEKLLSKNAIEFFHLSL